MKKNYTILNLIPFIIGSVIGIGAYYKIGGILQKTGGNSWSAISTWIVAIVIIGSSLLIITEFISERDNERKGGGILHVLDKYLGRSWSKFIHLYIIYIYFPVMIGTYAVVASTFVFGSILQIHSDAIIIISSILIIITFVLSNAHSILFGKVVQSSSVIVKLIPLIILIVVGVIIKPLFDSSSSTIMESFSYHSNTPLFVGISAALPAAMFALDGWQFSTSLTNETKGGAKAMVIALLTSITIIGLIYILYTIGGLGIISGQHWAKGTDGAPLSIAQAFALFMHSKILVNIITAIVAISALGALNGLTIFYNRIVLTAAREGLLPRAFKRLDPKSGMALNASYLTLFFILLIEGLILGATYIMPTLFNTTSGKNFDIGAGFSICSDILTSGMFSFVYLAIALIGFKYKKQSDLQSKSLKLNKYVFYFANIIMISGAFLGIYVNYIESPVVFIFGCLAIIISGLTCTNKIIKQRKS